MSTILTSITDNPNGYDKRIHMKGASEIVLGNCTKWMSADGTICDLDDSMKQHMLKIIEEYAKRALRTICLAYKDLKANEGGPSHEDVSENEELKKHNIRKIEETGLICFAILGIKDVIRPEVPGAVLQCKSASIKVRMVTGDNKITAKAIAKELRDWVAKEIGPIAKPKDIRFGDNLPKTRSGKIMRRLLRSIAKNEAITQDTSTLENPAILDQLGQAY